MAPAPGPCRAFLLVALHTTAAAALFLDECAGNTVCANAMPAAQACVDPPPKDDTAMNNWECRCETEGAEGTGMQTTATCTLDECTASCPTCAGSTCSGVGQTCDDSVGTGELQTKDWTCSCVAPRQGTATASAADCTIDECMATCLTCENGACGAAMPAQTCSDMNQDAGPRTSSLGDWLCTCNAPYSGTSVGQAAACAIDECDPACTAAHCAGTTCTDVQQDCVDMDQAGSALMDWECVCRAPKTGSAVAAIASCNLDECTATCASCAGMTCTGANPSQDCEDRNLADNLLSDWVCICKAPLSGERRTAAATCELDECTADCGSCAKDTCTAASQLCEDTDKAANAQGTWKCTCRAPATGSAMNAAALTCSLNECEVEAPECGTCEKGVCDAADQECLDPDPTTQSVKDWQCTCRPPTSGTGYQEPASCIIDECLVNCDTCQGSACTGASPSQQCMDADQSAGSRRDWMCLCTAPRQGMAMGMTAPCTLDECTATPCASCEDGECERAGQLCNDQNTDAAVLSDWVCTCRAPGSGSAVAAAATCLLDECTASCGSCEMNLCSNSGQKCTDPDTTVGSTQDWVCTCPSPTTGSATTELAECVLDECTASCATCDNLKLCDANFQDCMDPNQGIMEINDWECHCRAPESGSEVRGVATCMLNECTASCMTCAGTTCTDAGQTCTDDNQETTSANDWYCECLAPTEGRERGMPAATCVLDECVKTCATCAGLTCSGATPAQSCDDPDTSQMAIRDWTCLCTLPSTGTAIAARASCVLDECDVPKGPECPTCAGDACDGDAMGVPQDCVDPNDDAGSLGNWECRCIDPLVGKALATTATCTLDECVAMCNTCAGDVCSKYDQTCADEDIGPLATNDWVCSCASPKKGSATGQVAVCTLDECVADCMTCAGRTCSSQAPSQVCNDPNTGGGPFDESYSDWTCSCVAPLTNTAVAMPAVCQIDECEAVCDSCENDICANNSQLCSDPDISADAQYDWMCVCVAPYVGNALGRPATCSINECGDDFCTTCANVTCSSAMQDCRDPNFMVTRDWQCSCTTPLTGNATARAAECVLDECANLCTTCAGRTCTDQMQDCEDLDTRAGSRYDWVCRCPHPTSGSAIGTVAECMLNECTEKSRRCTTCAFEACSDAGQNCEDPNHSVQSLYDWSCTCRPPTYGSRLNAAVVMCWLDECDRMSGCSTCANNTCFDASQVCTDLDPTAASTNDWVCECPSPFSGYTYGRPVVELDDCVLDECVATCPTCAGSTCTDAGQTCFDESTESHANVTGNWYCVCAAPLRGRNLGAVATECLEPESPEYKVSPDYKASPEWVGSPQYLDSPYYKSTPEYQHATSPGYLGSPEYKNSSEYFESPTYLDSPGYKDLPEYRGSPTYKDAPDYKATPVYQDSPTYLNSSTYLGSPRFKDTPAYEESPEYLASPQYDVTPRYLASPAYKDTPEYRDSPANIESPQWQGSPEGLDRYYGSPEYKDTPTFKASPEYKATPQYKASPTYMNTPDYVASPVYKDSPEHKASPEYLDSPLWQDSPEYKQSPRYLASPQWKSTPHYDEAPQYIAAPDYDVSPAYKDTPTYDESPAYKATPNYFDSPRYDTTPRYKDSPAYKATPEYYLSPNNRETPEYKDAPLYEVSPRYKESPEYKEYLKGPEYKSTPRYLNSPDYKHLDSPEFKLTPEYKQTPEWQVWSAAYNREAGVEDDHKDYLEYGIAGALGGSLVGSVFAGAAATHVAAIATPCTQNGAHRSLPRVLHPTQLVIAGSEAMGTIVGNVAVLAVITWFFVVMNFMLCKKESDTQKPHDWKPRIPSPVIFMFALLHISFAAAGASLVLYPDNIGQIASGVTTLLLVIGVPIAVVMKVRKSVPGLGYYKQDPMTTNALRKALIGPGEWVSSSHHLYFVTEYASMIRSFKTESVWFSGVGFGTTGGLGLIMALRTSSWEACGNVMIAKGLIIMIYVVLTMWLRPHAKIRDNVLLMLSALLTAAAAFTMAPGYFDGDPDSPMFEIATLLAWGGLGCVGVKVLLDMLSELNVYCTIRRTRLEGHGDRDLADQMDVKDLTTPRSMYLEHPGSGLELMPLDENKSNRSFVSLVNQSPRAIAGRLGSRTSDEQPPPPPPPMVNGFDQTQSSGPALLPLRGSSEYHPPPVPNAFHPNGNGDPLGMSVGASPHTMPRTYVGLNPSLAGSVSGPGGYGGVSPPPAGAGAGSYGSYPQIVSPYGYQPPPSKFGGRGASHGPVSPIPGVFGPENDTNSGGSGGDRASAPLIDPTQPVHPTPPNKDPAARYADFLRRTAMPSAQYASIGGLTPLSAGAASPHGRKRASLTPQNVNV